HTSPVHHEAKAKRNARDFASSSSPQSPKSASPRRNNTTTNNNNNNNNTALNTSNLRPTLMPDLVSRPSFSSTADFNTSTADNNAYSKHTSFGVMLKDVATMQENIT